MAATPRPPTQALSVQSYHQDSPPFLGNAVDSEVPPLDIHHPAPEPAFPASAPAPAAPKPHRPSPLAEIPDEDIAPVEADFEDDPDQPVADRPYRPTVKHRRSSSVMRVQRSRVPTEPPTAPEPPFSPPGRSSSASSGDSLFDESTYEFPRHKLKVQMEDESKTPLVIVACGSFSPPTYLHLRMFEMASDAIAEKAKYEILGGYYSPVSDAYRKSGLAPAQHRVRMCELAVERTSDWLMVDPWEASQKEYTRTALVLDHFEREINGGEEGGIELADGSRRKVKIMLLAGGDLIESFGEPGVWAEADLQHILGKFGCLIVERTGSDVWAFLLSHDILYKHRHNVIVVKQLIYNDISSTKVRLFVRRGMSIKYLLPTGVIDYINAHKLYAGPDR